MFMNGFSIPGIMVVTLDSLNTFSLSITERLK